MKAKGPQRWRVSDAAVIRGCQGCWKTTALRVDSPWNSRRQKHGPVIIVCTITAACSPWELWGNKRQSHRIYGNFLQHSQKTSARVYAAADPTHISWACFLLRSAPSLWNKTWVWEEHSKQCCLALGHRFIQPAISCPTSSLNQISSHF